MHSARAEQEHAEPAPSLSEADPPLHILPPSQAEADEPMNEPPLIELFSCDRPVPDFLNEPLDESVGKVWADHLHRSLCSDRPRLPPWSPSLTMPTGQLPKPTLLHQHHRLQIVQTRAAESQRLSLSRRLCPAEPKPSSRKCPVDTPCSWPPPEDSPFHEPHTDQRRRLFVGRALPRPQCLSTAVP